MGVNKMQRIRQLRGLILAFVTGLALSNLSTGVKLCIAVPLAIVWFMSYDEKKTKILGGK